jgi:GNAT superfamily N-acetyltransferase
VGGSIVWSPRPGAYSAAVPDVAVSPMQFEQIRATAEVLARAFADSPITVYLVPKERARIITMRGFFIGGLLDAHKHGEAWVATVDDAIVGAGTWLPPGAYPPRTGRQLRQLAHLLTVAPVAPGSLVKSIRYLRAVEAVHPKDDHWYLATLGVDPPHQGKGYGGRLLDAVLPRVDEGGMPTYLETDKERNLAFYARYRFTETDKVFPVTDAPPTWTMWRDPVDPA